MTYLLGNASCKCLSGLFQTGSDVVLCVVDVSLCKSTSCKKQNINFLYPTDWPSQGSVALGYFSDSDILIKTDQACILGEGG